MVKKLKVVLNIIVLNKCVCYEYFIEEEIEVGLEL